MLQMDIFVTILNQFGDKAAQMHQMISLGTRKHSKLLRNNCQMPYRPFGPQGPLPLPNQSRIPTAAGPFALLASLPKATGAEGTRQLSLLNPYTLKRMPPTQYILSGGIRSAT